MNKEEKLILMKKVEFFKNKFCPIHVSCKNGKFYNGYITDIGADFFVLSEFEQGEQPLFYVEIYTIEEYKEKEER